MVRPALYLVSVIALAGGVAACQANSGSGDPATTTAQESTMSNSGNTSNTTSPSDGKKPPTNVQPSPWQPPAEVDPVLPPVEGDEPKDGRVPG